MGLSSNSLAGPVDPAGDAGWAGSQERMGFFTDTSICIGCKACEVACKEWNHVPEDGLLWTGESYDNTSALGASTWRHVAFVEQRKPLGRQEAGVERVHLGMPTVGAPEAAPTPGSSPGADDRTDAPSGPSDVRWLMSSDVCKHCTHAACLDVCPTGALFRTEFGTVVVQAEVCNGCGYCVPACPYGVIERREGPQGDPAVGVAQKCTLCYDRLGVGMQPACAKACPTQSIQYGVLSELQERADQRLQQLRDDGVEDARLYGRDPSDGVGGAGAFFLLLDEPEAYGLPPDPVASTTHLPAMYRQMLLAAGVLVAGVIGSFWGRRR